MTGSSKIQSQVNTQLSEREIEVLTWAARGKTYEDIGNLLNIASDTAKTHAENAGLKLHTCNKTNAVAVAITLGLIKL